MESQEFSLNPCSCGGWSQSSSHAGHRLCVMAVLILVLVEDGLRAAQVESVEVVEGQVLILVLVEDGLRDATKKLSFIKNITKS